MKLKVKKMSDTAILPTAGSKEAAGLDLYADKVEEFSDHFKIYTGISVQPDAGHFSFLLARSSLHKKGLMLFNSVGLIDRDYSGEVIGLLYKTNSYKEENKPAIGERLFQLVVQKQPEVTIEVVNSLDDTDRGGGGFGSSGLKEQASPILNKDAKEIAGWPSWNKDSFLSGS